MSDDTNTVELVPVTALIPAEQMAALKRLSDHNARSISGEVRLAIRAHLEAGERAA